MMAWALPPFCCLCWTISRMVLTDSCLAGRCMILLSLVQDVAHSYKSGAVETTIKGSFLIRRALEVHVRWPFVFTQLAKFLHRALQEISQKMKRLLGAGYLIVTLGLLLGLALPVKAQSSGNAIRMIREAVDETKLMEFE